MTSDDAKHARDMTEREFEQAKRRLGSIVARETQERRELRFVPVEGVGAMSRNDYEAAKARFLREAR